MTNRKQHIEAILANMNAIKRTLMTQGLAKNRGSARITPSQWTVLAMVMRKESNSIKDVATGLGVTSSATTQLVDELVNKGFLTRHASARDRRTLSLALSLKYRKKMGDMRAKSMKQLGGMFDALTDKELAQYAALNKKVAESIINKR
jgi:DNA-binding MarR family transcriptional regulator